MLLPERDSEACLHRGESSSIGFERHLVGALSSKPLALGHQVTDDLHESVDTTLWHSGSCHPLVRSLRS